MRYRTKTICFPVFVYSVGVLTSKFATPCEFCMAKISWMKGKLKNGSAYKFGKTHFDGRCFGQASTIRCY